MTQNASSLDDPAYIEGKHAYRSGVPARPNPYPLGTDDAVAWDDGWAWEQFAAARPADIKTLERAGEIA